VLSALLFAVGLAGALTRRNAILVLIGIELMLNAANLNFIAFWRSALPRSPHRHHVRNLLIGVAAAEAAVGLGADHFDLPALQDCQCDEIVGMKG